MNILFASNTPDSRSSGVGKMLHSTADEMVRKGHKVDILFRENVPLPRFSRRLSELLFPVTMLFALSKMWRRLGRRHDIVALHSLEGAPYVFLRKILKDLPPCVIVSHGSDEMRWELELEEESLGLRKISRFTKIFYYNIRIGQARYATKHADRVMVAAKSEIDYYEKKYSMDRSKVIFIPNGVSRGYFCRRSYARPAAKLLFVGGWEWRKGTRYLMEAFSRIALEFPSVTLTLAGVGEPESVVLRSFPETLRSRVRVVPRIGADKTPALYEEHDIFVFPSLFESMSLVVPEAMASGLPIVTTRACGMQDIIENDKNGFLVPPRDTVALAEKVKCLIEDPALRERLGKAAQASAGDITWDKIAERVLRLYEETLALEPAHAR